MVPDFGHNTRGCGKKGGGEEGESQTKGPPPPPEGGTTPPKSSRGREGGGGTVSPGACGERWGGDQTMLPSEEGTVGSDPGS